MAIDFKTLGKTTVISDVPANAVKYQSPDVVSRLATTVTDPLLLTMSAAYIGVSYGSAKKRLFPKVANVIDSNATVHEKEQLKKEYFTEMNPKVDDSTKLWSLQIDDYFMPLSQTFTLRAKKKLNVSSLVDGIDIIQQTRKQAKTIDCTLRLAIREDRQMNLQLRDASTLQVASLSSFLQDAYETNQVIKVSNQTINDVFGVVYAIMTEYKFTPRAGYGTYLFEFSLTEVKYGENVLTFNLREVDADAGTRQQIEG